MTVSGVFSSCETLAMKSRRMRATASSCVMSRLISSLSSTPNGTTWIASVVRGVALRVDDDRVGEIAGLEVADELRLAHEVDAAAGRRPGRDRGRGAPARARFAHSMRLRRVEDDHAVGNRLGGAAGSARSSCARSRWYATRVRGRAGRARRTRAPQAPRAFGHRRVERPRRPSGQAVSCRRWRPMSAPQPTREHRRAPMPRRRRARRAPPATPGRRAARQMPARTIGTHASAALSARSARHREPVAAAAHRLDQRVLRRTARAPAAAAGCGRRPCAPRCTRDRPTPGRAAARANARAPGARAGSAAAGTRSGRAAPVSSSTVTRCVAGSSLQRARGERLLRRLRRAPPQHRLDPRLQLARRERLGHVVVDPRLEARDLVGFVGARRDHDDRQLARARVAAQLLREREPRLPGQHPVEQHEVGQRLAAVQRLRASRRRRPRCTS